MTNKNVLRDSGLRAYFQVKMTYEILKDHSNKHDTYTSETDRRNLVFYRKRR